MNPIRPIRLIRLIRTCAGVVAPQDSIVDGADSTELREASALRLQRVLEEAECKLQEARDAWRRRWEQDAVRLACRIASRCLRDLPFDSAALAKQLVDESLRGLRLPAHCEVRLHPADYQSLTASQCLPNNSIVVLPDSNVSPGGCVVTTPDGVVDQTLESQMQRIEQELTDL